MISEEKLLALRIPDTEQVYGPKDVMLYALGLGCGLGPNPCEELRFVYEDGLEVLPTFPVVVARPGSLRTLETGIDWLHVVHGEQSLTLHAALPTSVGVVGQHRFANVFDKGEGRGALVVVEKTIREKGSGKLLATGRQTLFCRRNGGFGGRAQPPEAPVVPMLRVPDYVEVLPTSLQTGMIYRLSGDYNPLHIDPDTAKAAGFDRPILHGLATFGIAGRALLRAVPRATSVFPRMMRARFTAPALPGEPLRTEIWNLGDGFAFQVVAELSNRVVLGNGLISLNG
jgi:acyl dehydratase